MKNSVELRDAITNLRNNCKDIVEKCKVEMREMTEEEQTQFNDAKQQIADLTAELEALKAKLAKYEEEVPAELPEEEEEPAEEVPSEKKDEKNKEERNMKEKFSLIEAINAVIEKRAMTEEAQKLLNAGREAFTRSNVNYAGDLQIPLTRTLGDYSVTANGDDLVGTEVKDIVGPLRAKNVLVNAGAEFITGLKGDVVIPVITASNVFWEGEEYDAKDGKGTTDSVKLTPHILTSYVDITKQLLAQSTPDIEAKLYNDLLDAISTKLEASILGDGDGSDSGVTGIANGATATTIASFADITAMEAAVEDANVLGDLKYVVSPSAKGKLRNLAKSTKSTQLVMEGGEIDGTPVEVTKNADSTTANVIVGAWKYLTIGQWGGLDITVDTVTQATKGKIRLIVSALLDAKKTVNGAFAFGKIS